MGQKLSAQARRDKAARDLAFAKTPARRAKKAHAQRMARKNPRASQGRIMIIRIKDTKLLLLTEVMTDKELKKKVVKGMPLNALYLITKTKYFKHG